MITGKMLKTQQVWGKKYHHQNCLEGWLGVGLKWLSSLCLGHTQSFPKGKREEGEFIAHKKLPATRCLFYTMHV
jgi:hypothetical protein